jgi:hypothetical protein
MRIPDPTARVSKDGKSMTLSFDLSPTPDIVQRLRNRGHRIDLEAATTIEALREAVAARDEAIRVLGEAQAAWLSVDSEHRDNNPCPDPCLRKNYLDRARKASKAVNANPIARAACEGTTTETRTLPPLGP